MDIFVPDKKSFDQAMARTTHMVIAAHQDDIEIMAYHGILECYGSKKNWLTGVTLTSGGGSPRTGKYKNYSAEQMKKVRRDEQNKAAKLGKYGLMIQMGYESKTVKSPRARRPLVEELATLFAECQPEYVYTHNLADKHDTHVAVALATIEALKRLPKSLRPKKVYGCEVWRDLDWLNDEQKVVLPVSKNSKLALKLCQIFDSQVSGGKRYDLATMGRRLANATFFEATSVDQESHVTFAMDLTKLVHSNKKPEDFLKKYFLAFQKDVLLRLRRN
ncbi:MAG: PIG-L deacetylase family protein [Bdellovibrionales bacterium]